MRTDIAGEYITNLLKQKIIIPDINAEPSYEEFWKREIFRDMKEVCLNTCTVHLNKMCINIYVVKYLNKYLIFFIMLFILPHKDY